jgi:FkbM family methyltransferase
MTLIPRGHTVVDVGANNGVYTYALAKFGAHVEAFEPLPECARAVAAFGSGNVRVHGVALSSTTGVKELFIPQTSGAVHTALASLTRPACAFESVRVPVRRLDDYYLNDVSFIKIDVEGHEIDVLKGAAETIARFHPLLLLEVEQRHLKVPMEQVFHEVSRLGYRGFFVLAGRVTALGSFSFERHQQPFLGNVNSSEYVHNFIFLHENTRLRARPSW